MNAYNQKTSQRMSFGLVGLLDFHMLRIWNPTGSNVRVAHCLLPRKTFRFSDPFPVQVPGNRSIQKKEPLLRVLSSGRSAGT